MKPTKLSEIFTTPETWCKGTYYTPAVGLPETAKAYCLMGAVVHGLRIPPDAQDGLKLLRQIPKDLYPEKRASILSNLALFNDDRETTFEDIQRVAEEFDRRRMLEGRHRLTYEGKNAKSLQRCTGQGSVSGVRSAVAHQRRGLASAV